MSEKTTNATTWAMGALAVLLLGLCIWLGVQQQRLSTENDILRKDIATLHGRVGELEATVLRLQVDTLRPGAVAAARAARARPQASGEGGPAKAPRGRKAKRKAPANQR